MLEGKICKLVKYVCASALIPWVKSVHIHDQAPHRNYQNSGCSIKRTQSVEV